MKIKDMDVSTLIKQTGKAEANPGGGAILILMSNLAVNLMLMMNKKEWNNLKEEAIVSYETILEYSKNLEDLMQDDVNNFNYLMSKFKDNDLQEEDYLKASSALLSMIEINLKSLEILEFYLNYGKKSTLTDGEIANNLLREAIFSAFSTIDVNIKNTNICIDYEQIKKQALELYEKNKKIIERRK